MCPTGASGAHSGPIIAVLDDERVFLKLLRLVLEEAGEGYDVHTEPSLLHGYEFVKRIHPDVVVLDIMMGLEEVGWEVLDQMREDRETRGTPVIISSAGLLSSKVEQHGHEQVLLLPKPFRLEELLAAVRTSLATAETQLIPNK